MPKKITKTKVSVEEKNTETVATVVSNDNAVCAHCGRPSSIMSARGRFYCSLACQTNHGD